MDYASASLGRIIITLAIKMRRNRVTTKPFPIESDFDPWYGNLDAITAWKNFRGFSVEDAYNKFCESPEFYQEDFMFMGPIAFSFYFNVLEKYMATVQPEDELDDCCGWIIGCGIESQLEEIRSEDLIDKILRLSDLVIDRYLNFPIDDADKLQVIEKWEEVRTKLTG